MPSNLLAVDTSFPQLTDQQSDGEKITVVTNYLYMLLEQLRYTLNNLGKENFNDTEFKGIVNLITEPVYIQLQNMDGDISALQITAEGLMSRMTSAEGNISTLTQTANGLTARVESAEGNISTLQQTASGLTSRVANAEGDISTLSQTVNGMRLSVSNGSGSSTIQLLANGVSISSQTITFSGMVTFSDLSNSGWTTINGDNITTGTIRAIDIYGCNIEGSTFRSILSSNGGVGGEVEMYYISTNYLAGGLRLDDQGAGSSEERRYRLFLYTESVLGVGFAIKIQSASGISIAAEENIYMTGWEEVTISSPRLNLMGDVYINGSPYVPFEPTTPEVTG